MTDPLKLDTLVELRDQYSNVYRLSPTGARGWIRAKRQYPKTDPEVYVEWDKNHWRYHGEPDGWTFEHHFRAVDDLIPETSDAQGFPPDIKAEHCEHCGQLHAPEEEDNPDVFLNELLGAQEAAISSDGYFIITIAPVEQGDYTIYRPAMFSRSLNRAAREILEGQIMLIASELMQQHVQDRLQGFEDVP